MYLLLPRPGKKSKFYPIPFIPQNGNFILDTQILSQSRQFYLILDRGIYIFSRPAGNKLLILLQSMELPPGDSI